MSDELNNSIASSRELLGNAIKDVKKNKKTMDSAMDLVINLMKEVECKEKAADEAKEEAANSSLDILAKVDELKLAHQHAKDINDKHATEVCAQQEVLATEMKDLQFRVSGMLTKGGKSVGVLDEIYKSLEKRLTSALIEKEIAEKQKIQKELFARKALAHEENQIKKAVQESERLKQEDIKNSELQRFLADRVHIVDELDKEISDKCKDVNLLKKSIDKTVLSSSQTSSLKTPCDNKTADGCTDENELLPKIPDFDMEKLVRNKNELS